MFLTRPNYRLIRVLSLMANGIETSGARLSRAYAQNFGESHLGIYSALAIFIRRGLVERTRKVGPENCVRITEKGQKELNDQIALMDQIIDTVIEGRTHKKIPRISLSELC